jgi:predicted GIY-YIG superfamily endonuclease
MDNCSDDDMAILAKAPRPRLRRPVGQALPPGREDWTLAQLRGQPLPEAAAIVYVLAYARQRKLFVDVAQDVVEADLIRHRIERAQLRGSGKRGLRPLYWVYAECHASEDAAHQRCAEIKAMPHAWQRRIIDRFNPTWLSLANELIAFPCSRDGIGEDGVVMLPDVVNAATPAHGRWWVSALTRANARWSHSVEPWRPGSPTPIRAYQCLIGAMGATGAGVFLLLKRLRIVQAK